MMLLFSRHFKDTRTTFIIFALVLVFITLWIVTSYPTITKIKELQIVLEKLPPFVKAMIGSEILSISTFEGFMAMRYYNTTLGWLMTLFAVLYCASMISSDISAQRMDIILSQPVKRHQIILARFMSFLAYILILAILSYMSVIIGVWNIGIETDLLLPVKIIASLLPLVTAMGSICLFISIIVDDPIKSTSYSLGLLIFLFFLNTVLTLSNGMQFFKKFIIFTYFDATRIVKNNTVCFSDIAILISVTALFLIVSVIRFIRKEIYV